MNTDSKLIPKIKIKREISKTDDFQKLKIIPKKLTIRKELLDEQNYELYRSWEFTPFPKLFFPSEKKNAITKINHLNFKKILNLKTPNNNRNNIIFNKFNDNNKINLSKIPHMYKSSSVSNIYQENKGDITKYRSPAFSFGISREECKLPFFDLKEKISPSPGSYNLRPLLGLGGSSLKYSINKSSLSKNINKKDNPGPGHYNIDKCDSKNNGKIILSNFANSPICNFGKYKEKRDNNYGEHSEWNMKPDPTRYEIGNTISMFNGTGKYPLSNFRSNLSKSINRSSSLTKNINKFIYPGPGYYNHHSIFMDYNY